MHDLLAPFRRYADFRGRSDRTEFWLFVLFVLVVEGVLMAIDGALGFGRFDRNWWTYQWGYVGMADWNGGFLSLMGWLGLIIPGLAVAARRLHDANHSAGWLVLILVPALGWLILIALYTQQSWPVANRWGGAPTVP